MQEKREEWDDRETQSRLHLFLRQHYLHQVTRVYSQPPLPPAFLSEKIQHPQDEKLFVTILKFIVLYKPPVLWNVFEGRFEGRKRVYFKSPGKNKCN